MWLPWWLCQERVHLQYARHGFSPWVGKIPWFIHTVESHSEKKGWIIATHNGLDEYQNRYPEWKKSDPKENIVWFHVYEILEKEKNYSVRKINGCQHQGLRENCCKGYREISGVNVMLHSVVLVVITRLCIFIKTHQIVHLKLVTLLCVNYNSMKTVIIIKN